MFGWAGGEKFCFMQALDNLNAASVTLLNTP